MTLGITRIIALKMIPKKSYVSRNASLFVLNVKLEDNTTQNLKITATKQSNKWKLKIEKFDKKLDFKRIGYHLNY